MKTSITVSLLPSSPRMPFVLGPDIQSSIELAKELGFDAVEIFPPTLDAIDVPSLTESLNSNSIALSTIGTGGGAVSQGLTLTDADPQIRARAIEYIKQIMNLAAEFNASAIIGSMQGKAGQRDRNEVLKLLRDGIHEVDKHAREKQSIVFYEPLNRYESDLTCTLQDAVELIDSSESQNMKVLADLFHMNIEETDVAASIKKCSSHIGHVHFVDSNRRTAGQGHTDFESVVNVLKQIGFAGYLAVEAFPLPDQKTAARKASESFRELLSV